jgi:hypothetical protein
MKERKPQILFLVCLTLACLGVYAINQYFKIPQGLEGKYYANLSWQGDPQFVMLDPEISKTLLKDRRERFSKNQFSVAWKGFIVIEKSGDYTFATVSDDGSDLYVGDQRVVDNGGIHSLTEVRGQIRLEAGVYPIRIRYYQAGGPYALELLWARGNQNLEKIPSYVLSPYSISYRDYRISRSLDSIRIFLRWTWLGTLVYFTGFCLFTWYTHGALLSGYPFGYYFLSLCLGIITTFFIYPFADMTKASYFNSDSAIILHMIVENTPLPENIYYWGQARRGNLLFLISKIYYAFLGETHLLSFINLLIAFSLVAGFSIPIFIENPPGRPVKSFFIPFGFVFLILALTIVPTINTLEYATVDIAFSPEYLMLLNIVIFLSTKRFLDISKRYGLLITFSALASWINDLTTLFLALLAVEFAIIDFFADKKVRLWYWGNLVISVTFVSLLKRLSPYPSGYLELASWGQVRPYLGEAIYNLYKFLPPYLWFSMIILNLYFFLLWVYFRLQSKEKDLTAIFYFFLWVNLLTLGLCALVTPLFNAWFYENGAHPRYFATGIHLLFLSSSFSIVAAYRIFCVHKRKVLAILHASFIVLALLVAIERRDLILNHRVGPISPTTSSIFQSGKLLSDSGCEAVVGRYLNSYVYVLRGLGKLKATVLDGELDRSLTNTDNVLNFTRACVVYDVVSDFESVYFVRKKVLVQQSDSEKPIRLPDGKFFKHYQIIDKADYLQESKITVEKIVFGDIDSYLYVLKGFSGVEERNNKKWRWSDGMESEILAPLVEKNKYTLLIDAMPFEVPDKTQTMEVYLNDTRIDTIQFDSPGYKDYQIFLPKDRVKKLNKLTFKYGYALSPREARRGNDTRKLGVSFRSISFIRQGEP